MNNLQQYLVPYLISQVVAVVFLIIAYKNTKVARVLFALLFLGASVVNLNLGLTNPDTYLTYADMALPFYRDFIKGWFSQYNYIVVPIIAIGQLLIGAGMLLKGWWVRSSCIGAIFFLLAITPLMTGSAFPFPLMVSWASWMVLKRDEKNFLWKASGKNKYRECKNISISVAAFLSWVTWVFAAVAAGTGLFVQGIYRDNAFVQTAWRANDWVTLLVVLPALFFVLVTRNTFRIQLVWAGLLGYLIYNYAFYLFGAAFNVVFLVYAGIVASAVWALVDLLGNFPVQTLQSTSNYNRWIAGYLSGIAAMLLAIEVPPSIGFSFKGVLPDIVVKSNHPTSLVYALDLALVFPALVVAGYWLWKREPWGFVLAALMLTKAATYGMVLCSGTVLQVLRNDVYDPLLPFYLFITVGGCTGLLVLVRSVKQTAIPKNALGSVKVVTDGSYQEMAKPKN